MIDLTREFGNSFKVSDDGSWQAEKENKFDQKPWSYEIKGKYGIVYSGGNYLVVYVSSPRIRERIKNLGFEVLQWGEEEGTFKVWPGDLEKVSSILKLKKKRILSVDQKRMLKERLAGRNLKPEISLREAV